MAPQTHPSDSAGQHHQPAVKHIGLLGLICLVISAMLGGGIYNLPQNAAAMSSPLAIIIAWIITGVGMWFVANTFRTLSRAVPELKNGIYTYAERGFGKLVGFFVAYGYWVCNCFAMVAYGVLLPSTLNLFFPGLFEGGNNWTSVILSSGVTWLMFALTCRGAETSAVVNIIGTICKTVPIVLFVVLMGAVFSPAEFVHNLWGSAGPHVSLPEFESQIAETMLITLFLFIGIEGAVVVSGQARSAADVSRATTIGYLVTLVVYVAVSLVPFGIYSQGQVALVSDPAMATLLGMRFGLWGAFVVDVGIVVSVLSAWLVWMVMLGQMPLYAAADGVFPPAFKRTNSKEAPVFALLVTAIVIQVLLIAGHFIQGSAWHTMVSITAVMAMPCYLICCLFLVKLATKSRWPLAQGRKRALLTGIAGTIFSVILVIEANLELLILACAVYALGLPLYIWARWKAAAKTGEKNTLSLRALLTSAFTPAEAVLALVVLVLAGAGLML